MLRFVVLADIVDAQSQLQEQIQLHYRSQVQDSVVSSKREGNWRKGILEVVNREKLGKAVRDERQFEVAVTFED